jgi:hypothetical protein
MPLFVRVSSGVRHARSVRMSEWTSIPLVSHAALCELLIKSLLQQGQYCFINRVPERLKRCASLLRTHVKQNSVEKACMRMPDCEHVCMYICKYVCVHNILRILLINLTG